MEAVQTWVSNNKLASIGKLLLYIHIQVQQFGNEIEYEVITKFVYRSTMGLWNWSNTCSLFAS